MNDERLSQLLRSLPREEVSPYFKAGVLRRLSENESRRTLPVERLVLAVAAAVLVAAAALGLNEWRLDRERERERQAAVDRLEILETERSALETELAALRRKARDARPVVHLTSTPDYDVVIDMTRLARRARERTGRTVPALDRTDSRIRNPYVPVSEGEHRR